MRAEYHHCSVSRSKHCIDTIDLHACWEKGILIGDFLLTAFKGRRRNIDQCWFGTSNLFYLSTTYTHFYNLIQLIIYQQVLVSCSTRSHQRPVINNHDDDDDDDAMMSTLSIHFPNWFSIKCWSCQKIKLSALNKNQLTQFESWEQVESI